VVHIKTNFCSNDSERPHRCCHLPNNLVSHGILSILYNGLGVPPKLPPSLGDPGPQISSSSVAPKCTHHATSRLVQPLWHSSWLWQTDRQTDTDHATSVTIGNESVPIQLAQCRFPVLVISNARVSIYFSNEIYQSNSVKQNWETVMVWC